MNSDAWLAGMLLIAGALALTKGARVAFSKNLDLGLWAWQGPRAFRIGLAMATVGAVIMVIAFQLFPKARP